MNRRKMKWALSTGFTVFLSLGICCLAASGPKAKTLYERGQTAEAKDDSITAVSYTHLDVYKRQVLSKAAQQEIRVRSGRDDKG